MTCPHCGGEKEVLSLMSANTFGGHQWSDTRSKYPMRPQLSFIQKCPHCGKYFFVDTARSRYDESKWSNLDTGELGYDESLEAYGQLYDAATDAQRFQLCINLLYAFNDRFYRFPENATAENHPNDGEKELARTVIGQLIDLNPRGELDLLTAELYREKGDFAECLRILDAIQESLGSVRFVADQIREHAVSGNPVVFELEFPG